MKQIRFASTQTTVFVARTAGSDAAGDPSIFGPPKIAVRIRGLGSRGRLSIVTYKEKGKIAVLAGAGGSGSMKTERR